MYQGTSRLTNFSSSPAGLDNRIFDVLSTLQSHLADHPLQIVEAEPQQKEEDGQARIGEKVLMARVIFWTRAYPVLDSAVTI